MQKRKNPGENKRLSVKGPDGGEKGQGEADNGADQEEGIKHAEH